MEIINKLDILADSAKYDVSCSSSGSGSSGRWRKGNKNLSGLCHSWSADGRCISLLKILLTNICIHDCEYCLCRASNDIPREAFTPDEIAKLTYDFYRKNYIEGLFLSSGVIRDADHTMELMLKTVEKLRMNYRFGGYIHLKLIPGASVEHIDMARLYADRVSVNIELPSRKSLAKLAPGKRMEDIISPMKRYKEHIKQGRAERRKRKKTVTSTTGQSTQMIVGATEETDLDIINASEWLYNKMDLKRVYYSAYVPVNQTNKIDGSKKTPLIRENRLYQADWLMRFYGFSSRELLDEKNPSFDEEFDPKVTWALKNLDKFPVDINKAEYSRLLRVPGIGIRSAQKIVRARKISALRIEDLKKLNVRMKKAGLFITVSGKDPGKIKLEPESIKNRMRNKKKQVQFTFNELPGFWNQDNLVSVTGEF